MGGAAAPRKVEIGKNSVSSQVLELEIRNYYSVVAELSVLFRMWWCPAPPSSQKA